MFEMDSKTVSCAKKGTSYHLFPSESVTDKISTTLELLKTAVLNYSALPKVKVSEYLLPDSTWAFFVRV